jgi:hypothetical protein
MLASDAELARPAGLEVIFINDAILKLDTDIDWLIPTYITILR